MNAKQSEKFLVSFSHRQDAEKIKTQKVYSFYSKRRLYDIAHTFNTLGQDQKYREYGARIIRDIIHEQGLTKNTICDIGAGMGHGTRWLVQYLGDVVERIVAIDINMDMINHRLPHNNVDWINTPIEALAIRNESCQFITSFFSLGACISLNDVLDEIWRILQKGGYFIVVDAAKAGQYAPLLVKFFSPVIQKQLKLTWNHQRLLDSDEIQRYGFRRILGKSKQFYFLVGSNAVEVFQKIN